MRPEPIPPGVTFLDHTADVGLDVVAPTLAELVLRTAAGMACLIHGGDRAGDARGVGVAAAPGEPAVLQRRVALRADDLPALLRAWLREVLHWHESEALALRDASFPALAETALEAVVTLAPDPLEPIREIKGVTLHGLEIGRAHV